MVLEPGVPTTGVAMIFRLMAYGGWEGAAYVGRRSGGTLKKKSAARPSWAAS